MAVFSQDDRGIKMEKTHEEFYNRTGKRIMELRIQKRYTRECLAEMADISSKFLYEIEMGRKGCSYYVIYMLARSLDVTVDYLLQDELDVNESSSEVIYLHFEEEDKKHVDSIMQILYEITHKI